MAAKTASVRDRLVAISIAVPQLDRDPDIGQVEATRIAKIAISRAISTENRGLPHMI